ncbi:DUF4232 domain-containing protein [Streptomyces sp. NPDC101150]|uniref:DUF4232 domain-containing protein n=1 Tax=Streptomyces sp. NPDC101150 TaxID=3366114 RepID=UPI003825571E
MRARIVTTAAVFALSALALTGCGGNSDDSKKAGDESSASASSESPSKESGSGGASTGGNAGDQGDGATAACTTKNTRLQFIQSPDHASQQKPAQGTLSVTNTSKTPCTIVGAVTLTAKDDQGKAGPIETDNTEGGTDAVDVKPGGTAQASVAYTDLNFDGSPSGREICAVQATKVEIALPKDVGRTVKVIKDGGAPGSFNVCGKDVRVSAFTS